MKKLLTLLPAVMLSLFTMAQDCQQVQIIINSGAVASSVSWTLQNSNQAVILSGGNYNNNNTINIPFCLPTDCYTLTLNATNAAGFTGASIMVTSLGAVLLNTAAYNIPIGTFQFGINTPGCGTASVIAGCTDSTATNYNPLATVDNGTCIYPTCGNLPGYVQANFYICTFANGNQVAVQVADNNGYVVFEQIGFNNGTIMHVPVCVHPDSCYNVHMWNTAQGATGWYNGYWWINYNGAQVATNSLDNNLNSEIATFCFGPPAPIYGCMDQTASNYNPLATADGGNCIYPQPCLTNSVPVVVTGGTFPNEVSWYITSPTDTIFSGVAPFNGTVCLPNGCYTLHLQDSFGDGWNGANISIMNAAGISQTFTLQSGFYAAYAFGINATNCTTQIYGCTDSQALNYNPVATLDDNSCEYPIAGCTDPLALNYSPLAVVDNGSCFYPIECNTEIELLFNENFSDIIWVVTNYNMEPGVNYYFGWDFGTGATSSLAYPTYVYVEDGTYTICMQMFGIGANGNILCSDSVCFTVSSDMLPSGGGGILGGGSNGFTINVIDASQVSVTENAAAGLLNVYPNPATNQAVIQIAHAQTVLTLTDMSGRVVKSMDQFQMNGQFAMLNLSDLTAGVYLLHAKTANGTQTQKLIKQ